jgi:hypothetical protein
MASFIYNLYYYLTILKVKNNLKDIVLKKDLEIISRF